MNQIKVSTDMGKSFYSDSIGLAFNPIYFTFDFRNNAIRFVPGQDGKEGPMVHIEHKVIVMNPKTAKQMLAQLQKTIEEFEKKHGEIKIDSHVNTNSQNYFG